MLDAVAAPDSSAETMTSRASSLPAVDGGGGVTTTAAAPEFRGLVVGRRRQQRLEVTLAHGSITEVPTRVYVLGIFKNVAPSGAANAIDRQLDGAITEFTSRRMFSGDVGEVFTIPMGRNSVRAELVMLVGLGPFDRFNADVQQLVAENVVRTMVHSHLDEFATVLIGAGTGQSTASVVQNLLAGFLRGLHDADRGHRFRGITLCETEAARFTEMKDALLRLASSRLFEGTEVVFEEIELPEPPARTPGQAPAGPDPIYLMVRQERPTGSLLHFRCSLLGSGLKAAVVTAVQDVPDERFKAALEAFDRSVAPGAAAGALDAAGAALGRLMVPAEIATALRAMRIAIWSWSTTPPRRACRGKP